MRIYLDQAISLLNSGQLAAVPTETVYGLAASIHYPEAIEQIFSLKGRPSNNPLIIHASSIQQVAAYASLLPKGFEALANAFWPGPMTLVLPIHVEKIPSTIRSGLPTAAFRIPNHPLALELIDQTGPLVMPSANLSGKPSSTCIEHVEQDFGAGFPVLDGGACSNGLESTVLIFQESEWKIIRQGSLTPDQFLPILGVCPKIDSDLTGNAPLCPGQLYRHYAPKAQLILKEAFHPGDQGVVIGFPGKEYPSKCEVRYLGKTPQESAKNLYGVLRQLDIDQIPSAYIDDSFPSEGLWMTLRERLKKASQGSASSHS